MNPFNNLQPKLTASDKINQRKTSTIVKNTRVFANIDTTFETKNMINKGIQVISEKCNDISCNTIDPVNCHNFNNSKNKGCLYSNVCKTFNKKDHSENQS